MLYEYRDGLNAYFKSLGPDAHLTSLEGLIAFNKEDSVELQFFDQRYLEMAHNMDLSEQEYQEI
jgi:amidase